MSDLLLRTVPIGTRVELKAYALCRCPILAPQDAASAFRDLVDSFSLSTIPLRLPARRVLSAALRRIPKKDATRRLIARLGQTVFTPIDVLFEIEVHLERSEELEARIPTDFAADLTDETLIATDHEIAANDLLKWVWDAFLAMNLARPGAIQLLNAIAVAETITDSPRLSQMPVIDILSRDMKKAWPPLRSLQTTEVWSWLCGVPLWEEGFTSTPVGRAVQALAHLTETNDIALELTWAMVGLEALFTEGDSGLGHQIKERSQILLGTEASIAKSISRMYKTRSKFIHGKLDFAGPRHSADAAPDFSQFNATMSDAIEFGRRLLVASIQELIARKWHELQFSTIVDGS